MRSGDGKIIANEPFSCPTACDFGRCHPYAHEPVVGGCRTTIGGPMRVAKRIDNDGGAWDRAGQQLWGARYIDDSVFPRDGTG